jgi:hypothetical protein
MTGWRLPALFGLAAFLLYVAVLPATPGVGDSAEFTLTLALAGVPHPTGYPLFILLGHPFVKAMHALGLPWAAAANLWSAVGAAVAVIFLVRLGEALAGPDERGRWAAALALAPAAVMALHPLWLFAATQAEIHSWWFAWVAGAAWFAVARLTGTDGAGAAGRSGLAWGAIAGLGLAHHMLSIAFVLPLTLAMIVPLARGGRGPGRFIAGMAIGAAIPLASYGFIAWRAFHPAAIQWPLEPSWPRVWDHVRGAVYARYLGRFAPGPAQAHLLNTMVAPFLPLVVLAALWALRARPALRPALIALVAGATLLAAFVFRYGVPDPAMYLVPALLVGSLASVPALAWVARRASPGAAALTALAIVVAVGAWGTGHAVRERRRLDRADSMIRTAWHAIPFDTGIVLWRDDHSARLQVFQLLEGSRPGLQVVNPNLLAWGRARRAFLERNGFDPLAGLNLASPAYADSIAVNVRRLSPIPAIEFPEVLERVRAIAQR